MFPCVLSLREDELDATAHMLERGEWMNVSYKAPQEFNAPEVQEPSISLVLPGNPPPELVGQLRELFGQYSGVVPVSLIVSSGLRERVIHTDYRVDASAPLLAQLRAVLGSQNVRSSV